MQYEHELRKIQRYKLLLPVHLSMKVYGGKEAIPAHYTRVYPKVSGLAVWSEN
jgi:hypothetical protein